MATGDMKARLLLDGKEFDLTLQRAKKKTDDFRESGKKAGDDVTAAFKKVTAAIAAIKGAAAAFDSVINSSQVLGDKFRTEVDGMKAVFDNFIYSLANADFSALANGIGNAFKKGKEAAVAADQFGNTQMSVNFLSSIRGSRYKEAMVGAKNKDLTIEEREKWLNIAREEGKAIADAQRTLERDALEKVRTAIAAQTGVGKYFISEDAILKALTLDSSYNNAQQRAAIKDAYDRMIAENKERINSVMEQYTKNTTNLGSSLTGGTSYSTTYLEGYDKAMAAAQEKNAQQLRQNAELITMYTLLFRNTDEQLQNVYATMSSAIAARNQVSEILGATNEAAASMANEQAASAREAEKASKEAVKAERAAAKEAQKRAELMKKYSLDTGKMNSQANYLIGEYQRYLSSNSLQPSYSLQPSLFSSANNFQQSTRFDPLLQPYKMSGDTWRAAAEAKAPKASGILAGLDDKAEIGKTWMQNQVDYFLLDDAEKAVKVYDKVNSSIGLLSDGFASLGQSIGGTTGEALAFVGSLLDSAQAIVPLVAQIMAESAAHKANASAAATDAAAKTMSAYAGVPFAGVALGLTAVAGIISAIQSVPKFAEGGIVNRATLGVFGEAGPEAVMPLDKLEEYITPRELRVTGNIKASGKDLVVVLDNYNRVRNG